MKLLILHSDGFAFQTKSKVPGAIAEEVGENEHSLEIKAKILVVFTTVEKKDENDPAKATELAVDDIEKLAKELGESRIVVYPYAHLSSSLASSKIAIQIVNAMKEALSSRSFETYKTPFGWYKSFQLNCLGHNRAESLRSIDVEAGIVKEEEKPKRREGERSQFYILTIDNKLIPFQEFDYKDNPNLKLFMDYEVSGSRLVTEEPPHTKLMKKLELANYEPRADPGHLRWYPKGELIRNILIKYLYDKVTALGAMPIETPVMFNIDHPIIQEHLLKWAERQYLVKSGEKTLFLRFASDFGQFFLLSDQLMSYKNLPLRIYELTKYSFRNEQSGEVVGLRRLRAFTMPDLHTLCHDIDQAIEEFNRQFELCCEVMRDAEIDYEIAFRVVQEFWDKRRDWILSLIKKIGKPALIEIFPMRTAYWIMKFEFNFVDYLGKAAALPTVQVDVDMGRQYDINFIDEKNEKRHPIILHCSPSGALERIVYAVLEKAYILQKREKKAPSIPFWLSPVQVRIITISDNHLEFAKTILEELEKYQIRVDLDDRGDTVGKKIREGEMNWIPYIIVIGDQELKTKKLTVRVRETGERDVKFTLQEFIDLLNKKFKPDVRLKLPIPFRLVSTSPKFA
ncbi:MAG TPA: threonine--tRNA ligase [Candidatus Deferrimicrobium sp.]|nr:threonine--tRNA ligase [Candidatus Deferrimicrobium sp.]